MKKYLFIICLITTLHSCTDVIEVNVPEAPPRLVIEASMNWIKGTSGNEQTIRLSMSTPYFDNLNPEPVTGASVRVINNNDQAEFVFTDENNGLYTTVDFIPKMDQSYSTIKVYD